MLHWTIWDREPGVHEASLRGATGEISNFYNLSARLLIFDTHIPPITTTHISKFRSCLSDIFFYYDFFSFWKKGQFSECTYLNKF